MSREPASPAWHKFKPNRVYRETKRALWSWRRPQESAEKKKKALLQRRQDLTTALQCNFIYKRLTPAEAADFDAMWTILRMAFQHHRYFNMGISTFDWGKPDRRDVFWGNSWVNWFVLRAGASFWWKHYWAKNIQATTDEPAAEIDDFTKPKKRQRPKSSKKDARRPTGWAEINQTWRVRSREQMEIERAGAEEVFATIRHRMKGVAAIRLPTYDEYRAMVRSVRGEGAVSSQGEDDHLKRYCATMTLF